MSGQINNLLTNTMVLGEFSLDGTVNHVTGVLPSALLAKKHGFERIIVPATDFEEAALVTHINGSLHLDILPVHSLRDVVAIAQGQTPERTTERKTSIEVRPARVPDFADIKGQEHIKRALEVAMAGGHSVLMFGPPAAGKTMMAEALVGILPPLSDQELLEVLSLQSIHGEFSADVIATRR